MKIKAKMKCDEVAKYPHSAERVKLSAVYGDSDENKSYAQATPSASVEMYIDNPDAQGSFVPGEEYFVEFTPAKS